MCISKARWQSFVDWLTGGMSCMPAALLYPLLGPVWRLLPMARQAAEALGPWLFSLLEARAHERPTGARLAAPSGSSPCGNRVPALSASPRGSLPGEAKRPPPEARQRARLAEVADPAVIAHDLQAHPLTRAEAGRESSTWAAWRLEAELLRLVRLVEAPTPALYRADWPEWEVRYWAIVITLARIGQRYALLTRQPGIDPQARLLACAETAWQRATHTPPLAA
jgi:hypothetical protein